jgi:hypothetical protein
MKFTQEEIEGELSDVVSRGKRKDIAAGTGIYPSVVSGWFNPDDERKSPHFTVLFVQDYLDNTAPQVGDAVWAVMNRIREANRNVIAKAEVPLVSQILADVRTAAEFIQECSIAIADGSLTKSETQRLITALGHLQKDTGALLKTLHGHLGSFGEANAPLRPVA